MTTPTGSAGGAAAPMRSPRLVSVGVLVVVLALSWTGGVIWRQSEAFYQRIQADQGLLDTVEESINDHQLLSALIRLAVLAPEPQWLERQRNHATALQARIALLKDSAEAVALGLPVGQLESSVAQLLYRQARIIQSVNADTSPVAGLHSEAFLAAEGAVGQSLDHLHALVHAGMLQTMNDFRLANRRLLAAVALMLLALVLGWLALRRMLRAEAQARSEAEQKILSHSAELEQRVARRTNELSATVAQLKASEARFKDIAESGSDWLWETDSSGRFTYLSDRFEQISGLSRDQVLGQTRQQLVGPDQATDPYWQALRHSMNEARPFRDFQYEVRDSKGKPRYWRISGKPFIDAEGRLLGYHGVGQDVTRQIEVEAHVREVETRLQTLIANVPGVIFQCYRVDAERIEFPFISASLARMLNSDPAEVNGQALLGALTPASRRQLNSALKHSNVSLSPVSLELELRLSAEQRLWLHFGAHPRQVQGGRVVWEGVMSDLTERRMMESQLVQGQKMRAIGQLAAGIAHEINTPVQYVSDNLSFLRDAVQDLSEAFAAQRGLLDAARGLPELADQVQAFDELLRRLDWAFLAEEMPQAVEQAVEGAARIAHIVGAMKAFSHPGGAEQESVDLNQIIENTVTVARNEWKYLADMDLELATDLPYLPCFPGELGQVLLNMIVNAAHAIEDQLKLSGEARGRIRISSRRADDDLVIEIADTGAGIPPGIRDRIFDPFFTTKGVGRGSGQGLSIAHNVVVVKHGGSIRVTPVEPQGTCFSIHLPLHGRPAAAREDAA